MTSVLYGRGKSTSSRLWWFPQNWTTLNMSSKKKKNAQKTNFGNGQVSFSELPFLHDSIASRALPLTQDFQLLSWWMTRLASCSLHPLLTPKWQCDTHGTWWPPPNMLILPPAASPQAGQVPLFCTTCAQLYYCAYDIIGNCNSLLLGVSNQILSYQRNQST